MELFSEVYSCYFKVVEDILNEAVNNPVSEAKMRQIIDEGAFRESALYILPKLISEWNFLSVQDGSYVSKLNKEVKQPLTTLQKSWLKALLNDRRIVLFMEEEQIHELNEKLSEVEPLFHFEDFYYYDSFQDGDDYESNEYRENFKRVFRALKLHEVITISFESGKSGRITGNYLPARIEYSSKDDKFRVYCVRIRNKKIVASAIINLSRISSITESKESFSGDTSFREYLERSMCSEPLVIEISKERNALERCMLHFANFQKRTEYDEGNDKYICYIYYDKHDEMELIIRVLSFGPVIKVLGPEKFLNKIKDRVSRQRSYFSDKRLD